MEIYERLKLARQNANYSQNQIAEQLHISRPTLSRWENGQANPDFETLVKLCELYGVSTDYVLKGVSDAADSVPEEDKNTNPESGTPSSNMNFLILEDIVITATALITCMIPCIGLICNIVLLVLYIKRKKKVSLYFVLIAICLITSMLNTYLYLDTTFLDTSTIEKVASLY